MTSHTPARTGWPRPRAWLGALAPAAAPCALAVGMLRALQTIIWGVHKTMITCAHFDHLCPANRKASAKISIYDPTRMEMLAMFPARVE